MSDPITPDEMQQIRDWIATPPRAHVDDLIYRALDQLERAEALRARLDAAEGRAAHFQRAAELAHYHRDAALASPEGVVTLTDEERRTVDWIRSKWAAVQARTNPAWWEPSDSDRLLAIIDRLVPYQPEDPKHG